VASDCTIPAKHEANVLVRMEDDGLTLPPYDWAIEPQGLGPNVMTARTLFSDSQPQLVARVLNNSCEYKVLPADTFLSMTEPIQCLSDDGHKPASLLAKGDKSQDDALFWGESASPVPSDSPSAQMAVGETALHASSVSTAMDEATASSSSTPSTEGLQDHIESLLQRLPDKISLNQKSPSYSVVGVGKAVLPCHSWFPPEQTSAYTPAGYKTRNPEFCSCPLLEKTAGNQPPLGADMRLLQLFAHMACSTNDVRACAQLIGRCTILLASLPSVARCAVVSIVSKSCCCQLSVAYFVCCAVAFDRSLLRIYLVNCDLPHAAKMSKKPEGDSQTNPMVVESCGSDSSPRGGAMYSWSGDPAPATGWVSGVARPQSFDIRGLGRARPSPGQPCAPFPLVDPSALRHPREITGLAGAQATRPFRWGSCVAPQCHKLSLPLVTAYQAARFQWSSVAHLFPA